MGPGPELSDSYQSPTAISIDRDSEVTQKVAEENFESPVTTPAVTPRMCELPGAAVATLNYPSYLLATNIYTVNEIKEPYTVVGRNTPVPYRHHCWQ